MILSDRDIKKALANREIVIVPTPDFEVQLGACSLDLRLGTTFRVFNHSSISCIDPRKKYDDKSLMTEITVKEGEPFIMQPNDFVLAITEESIEISDSLMGRMDGRSSLGRLGIIIHSTAAAVNPGWKGKITLEIGNLGRMPVALYPGMRVCAIIFEKLTSPAEVPYNKQKHAKYLNQSSPVTSKINEEWEK